MTDLDQKIPVLNVPVPLNVRVEKPKVKDVINGYTVEWFETSGSSADIYKVTKDGEEFAMKVIRLGKRDPRYTEREQVAMKLLRHKYILSAVDVFQCGNCLIFIMDRLLGDLSFAMNEDEKNKKENRKITEEKIRQWTAQLVVGLEYLHGEKVTHRDIDMTNILLDGDGNIKIADFGFARSLPGLGCITPNVVSKQYNAPEMLFGGGKYSFAVDVWSIGVVMATLVMGVQPFDKDDPEVKTLMKDGDNTFNVAELYSVLSVLGIPKDSDWPGVEKLPNYPRKLADRFPALKGFDKLEKLDADGNDFLQRLLQVVPEKRITIQEAKNHPYIRKYYEESV